MRVSILALSLLFLGPPLFAKYPAGTTAKRNSLNPSGKQLPVFVSDSASGPKKSASPLIVALSAARVPNLSGIKKDELCERITAELNRNPDFLVIDPEEVESLDAIARGEARPDLWGPEGYRGLLFADVVVSLRLNAPPAAGTAKNESTKGRELVLEARTVSTGNGMFWLDNVHGDVFVEKRLLTNLAKKITRTIETRAKPIILEDNLRTLGLQRAGNLKAIVIYDPNGFPGVRPPFRQWVTDGTFVDFLAPPADVPRSPDAMVIEIRPFAFEDEEQWRLEHGYDLEIAFIAALNKDPRVLILHPASSKSAETRFDDETTADLKRESKADAVIFTSVERPNTAGGEARWRQTVVESVTGEAVTIDITGSVGDAESSAVLQKAVASAKEAISMIGSSLGRDKTRKPAAAAYFERLARQNEHRRKAQELERAYLATMSAAEVSGTVNEKPAQKGFSSFMRTKMDTQDISIETDVSDALDAYFLCLDALKSGDEPALQRCLVTGSGREYYTALRKRMDKCGYEQPVSEILDHRKDRPRSPRGFYVYFEKPPEGCPEYHFIFYRDGTYVISEI